MEAMVDNRATGGDGELLFVIDHLALGGGGVFDFVRHTV